MTDLDNKIFKEALELWIDFSIEKITKLVMEK